MLANFESNPKPDQAEIPRQMHKAHEHLAPPRYGAAVSLRLPEPGGRMLVFVVWLSGCEYLGWLLSGCCLCVSCIASVFGGGRATISSGAWIVLLGKPESCGSRFYQWGLGFYRVLARFARRFMAFELECPVSVYKTRKGQGVASLDRTRRVEAPPLRRRHDVSLVALSSCSTRSSKPMLSLPCRICITTLTCQYMSDVALVCRVRHWLQARQASKPAGRWAR